MINSALTISRVPFEDKSVLRNLLQLYLYDFSEFDQLHNDVDAHGFFGYPYFDQYWTEPARHPFLFQVEGKWAGFALVRQINEADGSTVHSLAEFFILRKYRGSGFGRQAAFQIFDQFPGKWHVAQLESNRPAQAFWRKVIEDYTRGNYLEFQSEHGPYQTFDSKG